MKYYLSGHHYSKRRPWRGSGRKARIKSRILVYETWSPRKHKWIRKQFSVPVRPKTRLSKGFVRPSTQGVDLFSKDRDYDGHMRLENGKIMIDIFESNEKNPSRAYVESQSFPNDQSGRKEAQDFLKFYGFDYTIV